MYYLHEDALGSVRLEATASVTIKFSSNYMPYGSNYAMTGKEVFMYTGKVYDASTGLYYLLARFYDPTIGRFITEDSFAGEENDPMSMDRYTLREGQPGEVRGPDWALLCHIDGRGRWSTRESDDHHHHYGDLDLGLFPTYRD